MSPLSPVTLRRDLHQVDVTAFIPALRAARAAVARSLGSTDADRDDIAVQAAIEALLVNNRQDYRALVLLAGRIGRLRAWDELRRRRGRSPEWRIRHLGSLPQAEHWFIADTRTQEDGRLVRVLAALPQLPPAQAQVIALLLSGEAVTPLTPAQRQAKRTAVRRLRRLLGIHSASCRSTA